MFSLEALGVLISEFSTPKCPKGGSPSRRALLTGPGTWFFQSGNETLQSVEASCMVSLTVSCPPFSELPLLRCWASWTDLLIYLISFFSSLCIFLLLFRIFQFYLQLLL